MLSLVSYKLILSPGKGKPHISYFESQPALMNNRQADYVICNEIKSGSLRDYSEIEKENERRGQEGKLRVVWNVGELKLNNTYC